MSITLELPARLEKLVQEEAQRTGKIREELALKRLEAQYADLPRYAYRFRGIL